MVPRLLKLDGTVCLGEKIRVKRAGEETINTNAQASAIAIQALMGLQRGKSRFGGADQEKEGELNPDL